MGLFDSVRDALRRRMSGKVERDVPGVGRMTGHERRWSMPLPGTSRPDMYPDEIRWLNVEAGPEGPDASQARLACELLASLDRLAAAGVAALELPQGREWLVTDVSIWLDDGTCSAFVGSDGTPHAVYMTFEPADAAQSDDDTEVDACVAGTLSQPEFYSQEGTCTCPRCAT